jgi:hypothetical protein
VRICSNCALFGKHRGHDIREEPDVVAEITERTELLIEMYQIVEQLRCNPIQRSEVEQLSAEYRSKSKRLQALIKDKFSAMEAQLRVSQ